MKYLQNRCYKTDYKKKVSIIGQIKLSVLLKFFCLKLKIIPDAIAAIKFFSGQKCLTLILMLSIYCLRFLPPLRFSYDLFNFQELKIDAEILKKILNLSLGSKTLIGRGTVLRSAHFFYHVISLIEYCRGTLSKASKLLNFSDHS